MKITIDIPDTALVMTYQFVFDDETSGHLAIQQRTLDSKALEEMREGKSDGNAVD